MFLASCTVPRRRRRRQRRRAGRRVPCAGPQAWGGIRAGLGRLPAAARVAAGCRGRPLVQDARAGIFAPRIDAAAAGAGRAAGAGGSGPRYSPAQLGMPELDVLAIAAVDDPAARNRVGYVRKAARVAVARLLKIPYHAPKHVVG